MKHRSRHLRAAGCWAALCLVALGSAGCRESSDSLQIQPSFVELSPGSNTVQFVVTGVSTGETFATPLDWSVSDPSLGNISGHSGFTAIYVANPGYGRNIITARDGLDNEGYATVQQGGASGSLTLTATPNPIPDGQSTTLITAVGGTAPFEWWVLDNRLGEIISAAGSDSAVYQSHGPGENAVHARDLNGLTGTLLVIQQAPSGEDGTSLPVVTEEE